MLPTVAAALLVLCAVGTSAEETPAHCHGLACRRATCGDVCTATDCSHFGNVCAGGVSAPAGVGWKYESSFAAPPLPPDFTSENATIFYYFNLLTKGQFVPQLTLGDGLCNGTGPPAFTCSDCDPNPKTSKQWYMQAQYFWEGHDPDGVGAGRRTTQRQCLNRRGGGGAERCHVIAGPLIPVEPGQLITTSFAIDAAATWHASISTPDGKVSKIQVEREYMEKNQTWPKTVGLGTCMEVDNLMRRGYYPETCPEITVTVTAPAGTAGGWQEPWGITEDPTCAFGPTASTVESKAPSPLTSVTKINYQWPGR
jgi:hypothetical protein